MSNRQAAVLVVFIPSVAGFFIARQIVPDPPAPARYEYIPFFKNVGVFRVDQQTSEVLLFEYRLQKRELVIHKGRLPAAVSSHAIDYEALGLDPKTGQVVDFDLYNRARQCRLRSLRRGPGRAEAKA